MTLCPECDSSDIEYGGSEVTEQYDEWRWQSVEECYCRECGCIWYITEETSREIEIVEHGKEYEE